MGSFRHNAARANVETPLLIIGGLLVAVAILALFQSQLRRRARHKQYHPDLQLESNGVLGQIQRRKDDLSRFVARLQSQLAIRQQQLHLHNELEEMVTARVQTARQQDQQWTEIMRAGKKVHGHKWNEAVGEGQPSLRELMEMHKDELLDMKAQQKSGRRQSSSRRPQAMQLPQREVSTTPAPRVVPPEWQSTRRTAGSIATARATTDSEIRLTDTTDLNPWSMNNFQSQGQPSVPPTVPKLDLSRLGQSSSPSVSAPMFASPKAKKSFQEMFQRQTKLASTLSRKKN